MKAAAQIEIQSAPPGRTIGEILLTRSLVSEDELDDALAIQRETGKPLGQVLVEAGTITRLELASALAEQWGDVGTISPTFPGGSAYIDPSEQDGNPEIQLEELRRTRRALEERMLAFERTAEDAQWQQEIATGMRALFSRVDVLEASLGEFTESGMISELRQLVVDLAHRTETMAPDIEALRERVEGTASVAALQYGLSEVTGRVDDVASGLAAAIDELRRAFHSAGAAHEDLAARVNGAVPGGAVDALSAAVEELRAAVADIAARPTVDPALAARVDAVSEDISTRADHAALAELSARLAELAERPAGDPALGGRLDELAARLDELGARIELGAVAPAADGEPDPRVDALIARVAELAGRPAVDPNLEARLSRADERLESLVTALAEAPAGDRELEARLEATAARLDELAAAVSDKHRAEPALQARLDETAHRIDAVAAELAGRADAAGQAELARLVAELAERPQSDPALSQRMQALATQLDELAARPTGDAELAGRVEELVARVDEVARAGGGPEPDGRVDELTRAVAGLAARVESLGQGSAGTVDPDLDQRLAASIHLTQSLTDQLHNATSSWDEARRALEARIEWLAARVEADAPAAVSAPAEGRAGKRRGGGGESDADVERLRMAVERLMLDFADHRRAISATVPARDLDERLRRLADQVDELSGAVATSGNGGGGDGGAPPAPRGTIDRDLVNQVKAALSRIDEVEASSTAGRETMLARLERMMGTIDWRLQRLENPDA